MAMILITGPDHKITLAIRRVLSRLETSVQARVTNKQSDNRQGERPYSSLSWHDNDLIRLQEKDKLNTDHNNKKTPRKKSNTLKDIRPGSINQVNKTRWQSPPVDFFDRIDRKNFKERDNNNNGIISDTADKVYRPPHRRVHKSEVGRVEVVSTETAGSKSTYDGTVSVSLETHQMTEETPPHIVPAKYPPAPVIPQYMKPRVPSLPRPSTTPPCSVADGSLDISLHGSARGDNYDKNSNKSEKPQSHNFFPADSDGDPKPRRSSCPGSVSGRSSARSLDRLDEASEKVPQVPDSKYRDSGEWGDDHDMPAYIDSYARPVSSSSSKTEMTHGMKVKSVYGKRWTPTSTTVTHPGMQNLIERRRLLHSAPAQQAARRKQSPQRSQSALTRYSGMKLLPNRSSSGSRPGTGVGAAQVSQEHHKAHCYVPGPHTLDPHNAYSISGPNSTMKSLLGPPSCPRDTRTIIHHRSAWYYVPGRTPPERDRSTRVRWGPTTRMLASSGDSNDPPAEDDTAASTCGSDLARTWPTPSRSATPLSYDKHPDKHSAVSSSKSRTTISVPIFKGVRIYQK